MIKVITYLIIMGDEIIRVNNVEFAYEDSKGGGLPILFIHGWMDYKADSDLNFKELSKEHRVIRFDLPGHGDSSKLPDYKFEDYVFYTKKFIQELKLDKVNLIGHSMGCVIATRLAEENPERYPKVVLIDPPLGPMPGIIKILLPFLWVFNKLKLLPVLLSWLRGTKTFQNKWSDIFIGKEDVKTARAREITIEGIKKCDPQAIVAGVIATLNNEMIVDVEKVQKNYYVIYGDKDPVINVENVNKYFKPDRIKVFEGEYHVPNRTDPNGFNEYILSIMKC
jgi:pimeloyl-ACP methyl ester carboxylesterase